MSIVTLYHEVDVSRQGTFYTLVTYRIFYIFHAFEAQLLHAPFGILYSAVALGILHESVYLILRHCSFTLYASSSMALSPPLFTAYMAGSVSFPSSMSLPVGFPISGES